MASFKYEMHCYGSHDQYYLKEVQMKIKNILMPTTAALIFASGIACAKDISAPYQHHCTFSLMGSYKCHMTFNKQKGNETKYYISKVKRFSVTNKTGDYKVWVSCGDNKFNQNINNFSIDKNKDITVDPTTKTTVICRVINDIPQNKETFKIGMSPV